MDDIIEERKLIESLFKKLSPKEQKKCLKAKDKMISLIAKNGAAGSIAFSLAGLKIHDFIEEKEALNELDLGGIDGSYN